MKSVRVHAKTILPKLESCGFAWEVWIKTVRVSVCWNPKLEIAAIMEQECEKGLLVEKSLQTKKCDLVLLIANALYRFIQFSLLLCWGVFCKLRGVRKSKFARPAGGQIPARAARASDRRSLATKPRAKQIL